MDKAKNEPKKLNKDEDRCSDCGKYDVNIVAEWEGEDENGVGWWRLIDYCKTCGRTVEFRLVG